MQLLKLALIDSNFLNKHKYIFLSIINSNRYSNQSERSVTQLPENSKCLVFGQAVFQASPLVPANTACYAGYEANSRFKIKHAQSVLRYISPK